MMALMALAVCMGACSDDDDNNDNATELQKALKGTYVELFTTDGIIGDKWDSYWVECCKAYTNNDEEQAQAITQALQYTMVGELYGNEAAEKYTTAMTEGGAYQFNCFFINGVAKFKFDGRNITGIDSDGNKLFSHNYTFVEKVKESSFGMEFNKYKSDDDNADEFTYFYLADDTPSSTYHIEFRYGSSDEALQQLLTGKYAFWLAAGIPEDADDTMKKNCIKLFIDENVGGEEE